MTTRIGPSSPIKSFDLSTSDNGAEELYQTGLNFLYNRGGIKNTALAIQQFELAANLKHVKALFMLWYANLSGIWGFPYDESQAGKYLASSFEKGVYLQFKQGAEKENADEQTFFGICLRKGWGIKPNEQDAFTYLKKAADLQHPYAQYHLGTFYLQEGSVVEKNPVEAVRLFQIAAEQEIEEAECDLGTCYYNGIGVQQNDEKAFEYYLLAVNSGYPLALYLLGICHELGKGTKKDGEKAIEYYERAAKKGCNEAQDKLDEMNASSEEEDEKRLEYLDLATNWA